MLVFPPPWVVVTDPGTDDEDTYSSSQTFDDAMTYYRALREDGVACDVMKRLPDGSLTAEY